MSEDTAYLLAIKGEVGKISGILEGVDKKLDVHAKQLNGQDGRLRTVENRQYWYTGLAATPGIGGIIAWLSDKGG